MDDFTQIVTGTRYFLLIVITAVTTWFFMNLLNQYVFRSHASASDVNVTFIPKSQLMTTDGIKKIEVFVQPADESKKISAFDLRFQASQLEIVSIGLPKAFPAGSAQPQFNGLLRGAKGNEGRISYIVNEKEAQQPHAVQLQIFVRPKAKTGQAMLRLDTAHSVVTGNADSITYDFGQVEDGVYVLQLEHATP